MRGQTRVPCRPWPRRNPFDRGKYRHRDRAADLGDGFGPAPETRAQTIAMAGDPRRVGGAIKDLTGLPERPIRPPPCANAAQEALTGRRFCHAARALPTQTANAPMSQ